MAGLKQKILATINLIFLLSVPSQCLNIKVHKDRELHETSPLLYGYTFEVSYPSSLPRYPWNMYE